MTLDIERLSGGSFLVIGRAGMDFYADPPGTPLEEGARFVSALGGSSANIAAGLCKLGCGAALVTCVSDDPVGQYCLGQLRRYGIEDRFVRKVGGEARNSLAVVDTNGDATQAVIYRNGAADFEMDARDIDLPYAAYSALITTGTVLAAEPSRGATLEAFARARAAGLPLIFDVDYRPYSWASADEAARVYSEAAALCDVIIGNDVEFGFMAGGYEHGLSKARGLAAEGKLVVYKMGGAGAITLQGAGTEIKTGVYETQAIKPTGAGDSFMAGFVAAIARGKGLREAVSRGSACAAMVVARVGCAPAMPVTEELDDFMAANGLLEET